jgi:hypothetical protein
MKPDARTLAAALGLVALPTLPAVAANGLCKPLQEFIESVAPEETRELKFHIIVGGNFKDREGPAYGARRCDFGSHEPGKGLCQYLMQYSSIESPGHNAKTVIGCLSPKTRFAPGTWVYAISFATKVGTETRGSRVDVVLAEDKDVGGTVLSIKAKGFQD